MIDPFKLEKKEDYYGNDLCVVRDKSYIFGWRFTSRNRWKKVFDDIDNLIKKLKYNELKVIEKNYSRFVQFSVMENHKTERTEEMISIYENITKIATGSYGLLYYLDDEDEVYRDEFRVLVSKKGKCEWKRDENFSPCSIMIEEFD